ncbi:hypothetical protein [Bythopirellula polymerisocia]|uniref:Transposase IS30-like HTH domain-containing protein n=1 Tax=Bythopirellula polymerisocia TaxID=2528003 RepID=A0A5C6CLX3_9BACT|nr:hypothetical protein [Bythopirellula polymerisocia]TWU25913.1 hypothetical protein Pla144_31270 [Bythopirellula polymerisocia]
MFNKFMQAEKICVVSNTDTPSRPPGRPRALADPHKRREICSLIGIGAGFDEAARHVGCSVATIRREANRDPLFAEQLAVAETAAGLSPLRALRSAASTNWRAAAWLLERTCPERFARRKPELLQPSEVRTMLDEIASIMADEITNKAELKNMCQRLDELQKARFGQYRSALQGDPAPKSAEQRYYEKLQRDIDEYFGGCMKDISDRDVEAAIAGIEASDRRRESQEAEQAKNSFVIQNSQNSKEVGSA